MEKEINLETLTISPTTDKTSRNAKHSYDKEALKERRKILGSNADQSILTLIRKTCLETLTRKDFGTTLQWIKAGFVQRDYEGIFLSDANHLEVYSAAYVPGRALCYYEIFCRPELNKLLAKKTHIYAIGSGSGSELVSLAAAMTRVPAERQQVTLTMQDIGDWSAVLDKFEDNVRQSWNLTQDQLSCHFQQGDVLDPDTLDFRTKQIQEADLITFMFVINELFTKKAAALQLIQSLVSNMKKGAYLLVVESAGSFSHLKVGDKTYVVYTLLDAIKDFERIVAEDSRWYRRQDNLKYPIDVQNMRYFIRLYKKR